MSWKDKYDKVGDFYEGRARVILNNKYGHVNKDGKITTPIIYDYIWFFEKGKTRVSLNGKYGYVDKDGKVVEGFRELIRGCFA
jgi:hypothetical protein